MTELQMTVSPSEADAYLSCERKHYYQYGLGIQSRDSSDSLNRGLLGHAALDVYFKSLFNGSNFQDAVKDCFTFLSDYMAANPLDLQIAMEAMAAIQVFFAQGGMQEFTILAVEQEWIAPLPDSDAEILFIVDLIVRDKDGLIGVVDHKFVGQLYYLPATRLMSQLPKYKKGLMARGFQIDWVAYNEFKASSKQDYRFTKIDVSDARADRTYQEHEIVAKRIIDRKRQVVELGTPGLLEWSEDAVRVQNSMTCKNCSMFKICDAELSDPETAQNVLDRFYKIKTRREKNDGPAEIEPPVGTDVGFVL
jgi:hypothetical protein